MEFDGDDVEVWLSEVLSRCADIARGHISSNNKDISGDLIEAKNRIQKSRKWNG